MQSVEIPPRGNPLRAIKRSITVGQRTVSISLEEPFWEGFRDIARLKGVTLSELLSSIMAEHSVHLSSAVRVYVLEYYRALSADAGKIIG